jgi:hypothetical protein
VISIALGIPHTPWIPARVESVRRLRGSLGVAESYTIGDTFDHLREFTDREPNYVWSERMWTWGAETDASHFLTLQDDVTVAPNFWPALRAMLESVPDQVIGLEVVHPAARALALDGHRSFTTTDGIVGVGYALPTTLLREFLHWRATELKPGAIEAITEDTLLALWCMVTGRRVWHPLPTIIDHDTTIASTYANDEHSNRRPLVRWDTNPDCPLEHAQNWRQGPPAPHLGRFYDSTPTLATKWVEGVTARDVTRWQCDDGRTVKRRLSMQARVRAMDEPGQARIYLATPLHGRPSPYYSSSVWNLVGSSMLDVRGDFEVDHAEQNDQDIMRTRSRLVRKFLATDCTHLLFVDADIEFSPVVVRGMLAAEKDFVAAPYPKRDNVDWKRARAGGEAAAYGYKLRPLDGFTGEIKVDPDGCVEVAGLPMGCALLSRSVLDRMVEHYRSDLAIDDDDGSELVELFWAPMRNRRRPSEDYAFCERWREMGGKVWLYLGPGSPVTHHGDWAFRGHVETFGLRHA